jgi:hypothetical protein
MAVPYVPGRCSGQGNNAGHEFEMKKTTNPQLLWACYNCHSGPHQWIFECKYCQIKVCRECTQTI